LVIRRGFENIPRVQVVSAVAGFSVEVGGIAGVPTVRAGCSIGDSARNSPLHIARAVITLSEQRVVTSAHEPEVLDTRLATARIRQIVMMELEKPAGIAAPTVVAHKRAAPYVASKHRKHDLTWNVTASVASCIALQGPASV
jgi:hypothetical protein